MSRLARRRGADALRALYPTLAKHFRARYSSRVGRHAWETWLRYCERVS